MTNRRILRLSGPDTHDFLQGLITTDMGKLSERALYAALLTPQGKYLADFFVVGDGQDVLLDVAEPLADMLVQRLTMYKLRAKVEIAATGLYLHRGLSPIPQDGYPDPRSDALGWRAYRKTLQTDDTTDWTALRVAHLVPETGVELTSDTFILEAGFERLNGVDFRKGCYVGQEVTARMKHKTELRKGFAKVKINGSAPIGTPITVDGKVAGALFSQSSGEAIAYLRFDRAQGEMQAGEATITRGGAE